MATCFLIEVVAVSYLVRGQYCGACLRCDYLTVGDWSCCFDYVGIKSACSYLWSHPPGSEWPFLTPGAVAPCSELSSLPLSPWISIAQLAPLHEALNPPYTLAMLFGFIALY